jgi:hypothetical protein
MSWLLPTPLLLFARVVALLPRPVLGRRPSLAHPLLVEAFVTTLAVIALVWLDWEEALAWCLGWLMVLELGIALFRG